MTTDTSREVVEALIARARDAEKYDLLQTFFPQAKPSDRLGTVMVDTLAALLDERDAAREYVKVHAGLTATDRESALQQRIRDLEATVDNLRLISNANGDWNIKYQEVNHRAERAEAERDEARTALDTQMSYVDRALAAEAERDRIKAEYDADFPCDGGCNVNDGPDETCSRHGRRVSEVWEGWRDAASERDKLTAKLDAVKAALNASDHEPTNRVWHEQMQRLRAILADTDEGSSK